MPFETLPPIIAAALAERGYTELTPVQAAVVEAEAHGRDLIVSARTGSGKTVAFGLALADALLAECRNVPLVERPLALVIAPTRELALQVSRELAWLFAGPGCASPPASAGWTHRRSAGPCAAGPPSSSARPGGCATIWNAARSTCPA